MKPRISRRFAIWAANVLVTAAIVVAFWLSNRELVYQGRTVSQWIADVRPGIGFVGAAGKTTIYLNNLSEKDRKLLRLDDPQSVIADTNIGMLAEFSPDGTSTVSNFITPDRDTWEANQRILELGEKAVPSAITMLSRRRPRLEVHYESVWSKLPTSLQRLLPLPKPPPDANRRVQAAYSLGIVDSSAKAALPALERALTDESNWVRAAAYEAIRKIDTNARPFLLETPFR